VTNPTPLPGRPRYLAFLPDFLFAPADPFSYIAKAWLLVLGPSLVLSALVQWATPAAERPDIPMEGLGALLMLVVAAPFLETLLMAGPLLLLNRFVGAGPAVLTSAILWGVAHSLSAARWGLVAWWPFLVFSIAFLAWRESGFVRAILIVSAIHALQNGFAAALYHALSAAAGAD
jgi:membrane protease YdiL (CAAX protease family)